MTAHHRRWVGCRGARRQTLLGCGAPLPRSCAPPPHRPPARGMHAMKRCLTFPLSSEASSADGRTLHLRTGCGTVEAVAALAKCQPSSPSLEQWRDIASVSEHISVDPRPHLAYRRRRRQRRRKRKHPSARRRRAGVALPAGGVVHDRRGGRLGRVPHRVHVVGVHCRTSSTLRRSGVNMTIINSIAQGFLALFRERLGSFVCWCNICWHVF